MEFAPQPSWLLPVRKAGIARFAEAGFPTLRDEDWRFTNVAPLAKLPFTFTPETSADGAVKKALADHVFAKLSGPRLVFVNSYFQPALSAVADLPPGVKVASLRDALASDAPFVEEVAQPLRAHG